MTASSESPEPIRIVFEDADLVGWVVTGGQRMTDILKAGEPFAFLPGGGDSGAWTEVFPDETLLVVPPPHVSPPALRLPGNQHEVLIRTGGYRIVGTAHLRPGEQDDPILRATRRFLPVTRAGIGRDDEPEAPVEMVEVVIVNLRRTSEFRIA